MGGDRRSDQARRGRDDARRFRGRHRFGVLPHLAQMGAQQMAGRAVLADDHPVQVAPPGVAQQRAGQHDVQCTEGAGRQVERARHVDQADRAHPVIGRASVVVRAPAFALQHQHGLDRVAAVRRDVAPISPEPLGDAFAGSEHDAVEIVTLQPVAKTIDRGEQGDVEQVCAGATIQGGGVRLFGGVQHPDVLAKARRPVNVALPRSSRAAARVPIFSGNSGLCLRIARNG